MTFCIIFEVDKKRKGKGKQKICATRTCGDKLDCPVVLVGKPALLRVVIDSLHLV